MRGDVLIIQEWHRKAGLKAAQLIIPQIEQSAGKFTITVAGESGSGKSEIAEVIAEALIEKDINSIVLQQDDYFVHPPKTNENTRRKDIDWVGANEVHLDIMDQNLNDFKEGKAQIAKPLVIFEEDRIIEETINIDEFKVAIAEGTFTTTLNHVDCRVFIDQTYHETKKARLLRAREEQDDFLETVLKIEHKVISSHKRIADFFVTGDYDVVKNEIKGA
ncbi:MAG: zeta toxin family protein [Chloroflexi bacterium]|nr:zeta toxin family protein [Chloroflexota bacterium]